MTSASVTDARRLAEEVLFPRAAEVDRAERVPTALLDALAEQGFYATGAPPGLVVPDRPALDLPDDAARAAVVEAFAGGCLSAAFVWQQHRGALRAVAAMPADGSLREEFLPAMAAGRARAGLAIGAATRTGPPLIRATEVDSGWSLTGTAPWVTGWGMVDVLLAAARDGRDRVIWSLVDAVAGPCIRPAPLDLVAVRASGTVTLELDGLIVPSSRVLSIEPQADYLARDAESLTSNGFLAVGVAGRAIGLIEADDAAAGARLRAELDAVRTGLLGAGAAEAPAARAAASELALRAAGALAVRTGSRSVLTGSHAERLLREALFLLTFGTRPTIRSALLDRLTRGVADRFA